MTSPQAMGTSAMALPPKEPRESQGMFTHVALGYETNSCILFTKVVFSLVRHAGDGPQIVESLV